MHHALIVEDNALIRRAVQAYLRPLGFNSFDHTWTAEQALEAAHERAPDLIVLGLHVLDTGTTFDATRDIAAEKDIPVLLLAQAQPGTAQLEQASSVAGPFRLDQIDMAVELALADPATTRTQRTDSSN